MRSYTKWFNTIPLLGVGAVGANKYFTSEVIEFLIRRCYELGATKNY